MLGNSFVQLFSSCPESVRIEYRSQLWTSGFLSAHKVIVDMSGCSSFYSMEGLGTSIIPACGRSSHGPQSSSYTSVLICLYNARYNKTCLQWSHLGSCEHWYVEMHSHRIHTVWLFIMGMLQAFPFTDHMHSVSPFHCYSWMQVKCIFISNPFILSMPRLPQCILRSMLKIGREGTLGVKDKELGFSLWFPTCDTHCGLSPAPSERCQKT